MLDLTNLNTIKQILRDNNFKPKKGYGQNFLVAQQPLITLIKSAQISADDVIIEVGPGLGVLTQELAKHAKLVLAIESDYQMVQWLRKYFKNQKNVKIIHEDILKFSLENLQIPNDKSQISNKFQTSNDQNSKQYDNITIEQYNNFNYKVVSNLPYNITSPVIRKFLEADMIAHQSQKDVRSIEAPQGFSMALATHFLQTDSQSYGKRLAISPMLESMVLMVQKEVAERLTAKPGSSDRGILTVMVELFGGVYPDLSRVPSREGGRGAEIVEIVPRDCFWPVPKVDSAIIKIQNSKFKMQNDNVKCKIKIDTKSLMKFVKIGFSQKRRQIHHPLSANVHLPNEQIKDILKSVGVEPTLRAEDLTLDQWVNLFKTLSSNI